MTALQAFFLAIGMHPEVQAKAQEQLDSVVGQDRLPEFDDMSSLPYIEAILLESLRWHPVAPIGELLHNEVTSMFKLPVLILRIS